MESAFNLKMLSNSGIQKMTDVGLLPFLFLMLASLLASLFISHLYVRFYGSKGTGSTLHRAFPLLGLSITSIFISLQFSIPLSLGLLGALSIVRFRTPIKDPEEVGFILLVIATSLTCATFNIPFLLLIMLVAIVGLIVLKYDKRFFRRNANEGMIILKINTELYEKSFEKVLSAISTNSAKLTADSIIEEEDITTLSYSFSKLEDSSLVSLKSSLKEIDSSSTTSIFYSQNIL
jgi:hypothetical protein